MDKQLLKAYIKTVVEEELQRILPIEVEKILVEAINDVKKIKLNETSEQMVKKSKSFDKRKLAELMNISYDGETLMATTSNTLDKLYGINDSHNRAASIDTTVNINDVDPNVITAINKDYSSLMKKMGMVK